MKSGVHLSLHPNCHQSLQNLICLFCIHHLPKELFSFIKKQMLNLSEGQLMNTIEYEPYLTLMLDLLHNLIHDFIPHKRIVCNGRDPSWINNKIKKLINNKSFA